MKKGSAIRPIIGALLLLIVWALGFELSTDFSQSDAGTGWGILFWLIIAPIFLILVFIGAHRFFRKKKKTP